MLHYKQPYASLQAIICFITSNRYRRCQSRTTISITIKKNDYLCRTLGRNMTEGLAVLIIANVANAMKTIKAVTANKGKC